MDNKQIDKATEAGWSEFPSSFIEEVRYHISLRDGQARRISESAVQAKSQEPEVR